MPNEQKSVSQAPQPEPQAIQPVTPTASYGTRAVRDSAEGKSDRVVKTASYGTNIIRNSKGGTKTKRLVRPKL